MPMTLTSVPTTTQTPQHPHHESRLEVSDHEKRLRILFAYAAYLFVFAFYLDTPKALYEGMLQILTHPSNLLSDYMVIGGLGAAVFNAALMTLLSAVMVKINKVPVSGSILAAIFTISGFSLFGKNLFNSIPITIGVHLYSRFSKGEFKQQILIALYGTALGPLVSYITFAFKLPFHLGMLYGYLVGILCGFLLPPLAAAFIRFHQGFSLYNVGFTAGIIGMMAIGALRFLNWEISNQQITYVGDPARLVYAFCLLFFLIGLAGFWLNGKSFHGYRQLLKSTGRIASDFVILCGFPLALLNIAIMGLLATAYALLVGGQLNGPILGGILTVAGFGAFGKHPYNVLPILLGVLTINMFTTFDHTSTTAVLAGLFGTTLAPISGQFGVLPGILAGFIHMTMVLNVGALHSGVNLYNNGFSGGFVAAIMVPLLEMVQQRELLPKQIWKNYRRRRKAQRATQKLGEGGQGDV